MFVFPEVETDVFWALLLVDLLRVLQDLSGFRLVCGGPYWERSSVVEPRLS